MPSIQLIVAYDHVSITLELIGQQLYVFQQIQIVVIATTHIERRPYVLYLREICVRNRRVNQLVSVHGREDTFRLT